MEDNNNSADMSAVLQELQTLNQGISTLNKNQKELTEYIVIRDRKADEEKARADELAAEDKEVEDQRVTDNQIAEQKAQEDRDQQQADQAETYTELLNDSISEMQLTNQLLSVQTIYFGIIIGLLFIKIFIDRLTKR